MESSKRRRKRRPPHDWRCNECGKRMTLATAEEAAFGSCGCPRCGSSDVEWAPEFRRVKGASADTQYWRLR